MTINNSDHPENVRFFCRVSSRLQHVGSMAKQERILKQHQNLLGEKGCELLLKDARRRASFLADRAHFRGP